ncbi:hypothetical protein [Bacillus cereus group sp. BfR-BA-01538]|uniref:hypothetical protein n=1 Tax=Bacillus cereus group sp. BfR-BA-01538 TaxID=2920373 RepID=UPI001F5A706A
MKKIDNSDMDFKNYGDIYSNSVNIQVHIPDHEQNEEEGKKWTEGHKNNLDKDLTPVQKETLERLFTPEFIEEENYLHDINQTLKITGGMIENLPNEKEIKDINGEVVSIEVDPFLLIRIDRYENDVNTLDEAFKHLSGKTDGVKYFYKEMNTADFGFTSTHFLDKDGNLLYEKLETDFENAFLYKYGLSKEYMEVKSFYKKQHPNPEGRILLKLKTEKGTNIVPINNETIYLNKNSGFYVESLETMTLNGQDVIKINGIYLEKEDLQEATDHIQEIENLENHLFSSLFEFSPEKKLIEFRMSDVFASGVAEQVKKVLLELKDQSLTDDALTNFLKNTTKYILEKNGKIIFTDIPLGYISEVSVPRTEETIQNSFNVVGRTNRLNRNIALKNFESLSTTNYIMKDDLLHELTHIQDMRLGELIYGDTRKSFTELNKDFKDVFFEEGKNSLPEPFFSYAKTTPTEYLAEIHSFMHSNRIYEGESYPGMSDIQNKKLSEIVKDRVPYTVEYITALFKKY